MAPKPHGPVSGALVVVLLTVLLAFGCIIPVYRAAENDLPATVQQLSASVNTRRLANVLGDEFVSFSAKPADIFDGQGNPICETSFLMAQSLGRTYLKVVADSSQLHLQTAAGRSVIGGPDDAGLVQIKASAWQAFYDWAHRAGIVPVFVLDYPTDGVDQPWDAKRTLQVLSAASVLGVEECLWQLGNGNVADASKYWEDLRTFRTMLKAFPRQRWGMVACELNPDGSPEDVRFFHVNIDTLVDAVSISKPLYGENSWNYSTLQREVHLRGLSKQRIPLWLDLVEQNIDERPDEQSVCDERCLRQGLQFARILGEAARGGVSAVFKPVHRASIQRYTLNYLTALLYKRTVGNKVFPVLQEAFGNARTASVYAYCTRNVTGSVTLVVVNEEPTEAVNATIMLQTRALTSPVELFLLGVQNGQPTVNNRAFPDGSVLPELVPVTAITTLTSGVSFYVPAQTILFAIVPGVQVRECRINNVNAAPKLRRSETAAQEDVPRDDLTSTDVLLEELIGALLEQSSLEPLQRRRRAIVSDSPRQQRNLLPVGSEKRKRFHARASDASQDGDFAASLAKAIAQAHPDLAPTERTVRGPRQTQAYKRQQRRIRNKEKRAEQRSLRRMKHPLIESQRERTKRGGGQHMLMRRVRHHPQHQRIHERLLKRMSAKLASRKTKRSSLAEAVNEPPSFATSDEEGGSDQQGRSDFPLGDVHLVISKTSEGESGGGHHRRDYSEPADESDEAMIEYRKPEQRRLPVRHRPGVRRRISISQRDFHRFGMGRPELDSDELDCCKHHRRRTSRRENREMEAKETRRIDRYFPIQVGAPEKDTDGSNESGSTVQLERKDHPSAGDNGGEDYDEEVVVGRQLKAEKNAQWGRDSSAQDQAQTEQTMAAAADTSEEMRLFTPAPRESGERPPLVMPWDEPSRWSQESSLSSLSSSAEVTELLHRRYKRSVPELRAGESREVERLEDFFRTNAKLQQKFAEMFDLLLEALEELESEENDAREDDDELAEGGQDQNQDQEVVSENETQHRRRAKRNALLHPQSWESRERSNMIQQRAEESMESNENQIIPVVRIERDDLQPNGTVDKPTAEQDNHDQEPPTPPPSPPEGSRNEGKPGAFVLRTVVNFVRRATSEFHQLFSGWFHRPTEQ